MDNVWGISYIFSGWKWSRIAQNARPFLQEVEKFEIFTPLWSFVTSWHHFSRDWLDVTKAAELWVSDEKKRHKQESRV